MKFRIWNAPDELMEYSGYQIDLQGKLYNLGGSVELASDYKVMQHTGLRDRNGTEVYEADIVEIQPVKGNRVKREIVWNDKTARFSGYSPRHPYEVVGNIYETNDLSKSL